MEEDRTVLPQVRRRIRALQGTTVLVVRLTRCVLQAITAPKEVRRIINVQQETSAL